METYHAYYSNIAAERGCPINQYIDVNNNIIAVTHVYTCDYKPNFPDLVYLGIVTKWIKNIRSKKFVY